MGGKKAFELMLEIGFKSQPLKAKLPNGYTHKWTVFVKGANNTKIEHCIQKVVFQLHDSFPDPEREITEPPFQIRETGYAGFEIPVQIYFKNRDKPNHLVFQLDLILMIDRPHSSVKNQKVSFYNPNREFEKCLMKTGAQMILMNKEKKERSDSPPAKKQKSSSLIPSKDMAKQEAQFIDVFGAPLAPIGGVGSISSKIQKPAPRIPAPTRASKPQDPFQAIKDKISVLTDCDRLQKIVDIIEESGQWYNLTASKFEFDLKRLDKKTLYKIEKLSITNQEGNDLIRRGGDGTNQQQQVNTPTNNGRTNNYSTTTKQVPSRRPTSRFR